GQRPSPEPAVAAGMSGAEGSHQEVVGDGVGAAVEVVPAGLDGGVRSHRCEALPGRLAEVPFFQEPEEDLEVRCGGSGEVTAAMAGVGLAQSVGGGLQAGEELVGDADSV